MSIRIADQPGDLGWILQRHGEIYADGYGWNLVPATSRILADFAALPPLAGARAWIAEVEGRRAGCVLCVPGEHPDTGVLRLLLVEPFARGRGIGAQLTDTCLDFARDHGYRRMRLWTNSPLVEAASIYRSRGFVLVDERQHDDFGPELLGQTYLRDPL